MIDTTRSYTTREGKRVVLHEIVERNSAGNKVTFPVKGSVIISDRPRRTRYQIWTMEGKASVLSDSDDDIMDLALPTRIPR